MRNHGMGNQAICGYLCMVIAAMIMLAPIGAEATGVITAAIWFGLGIYNMRCDGLRRRELSALLTADWKEPDQSPVPTPHIHSGVTGMTRAPDGAYTYDRPVNGVSDRPNDPFLWTLAQDGSLVPPLRPMPFNSERPRRLTTFGDKKTSQPLWG